MIEQILGSTQLPSPPTVAIELLEHTKNPDATIEDFVNVIKTDPAMSVKILKAANSSYFSFRSEITSLERAISMIGRKPIAALVLGFSLVNNGKLSNRVTEIYRDYWLQAVIQGITAEFLASRFHRGLESEAFLVGLLMDLGRLAMLKVIPEEYADIIDSHDSMIHDLHTMEQEHLQFSHVDIAVKLLANWQISPALVEAIAAHHADPFDISEKNLSDYSSLSRIAIFSAVAGDCFCTQGKGRNWERLQHLGKLFYQLDETALEQLLGELKSRLESGAQLFSVNTSDIITTDQLVTQARDQLVELAFQAQLQTAQVFEEKLEIEQSRNELEHRNRILESEVIRDGLTNVFTRRYFDEAFVKEINRCSRNQFGAAVLFCDIDNFKSINDNYGHVIGDQVLIQVADAIKDPVRTSDTVARYGGEEFVIMLVDVDPETVEIIAERVRSSVEQLSIRLATSSSKSKKQDSNSNVKDSTPTSIQVTLSIGGCLAVSVSTSESEAYCKKMLQMADEEMYFVKKNGKNGVRIRRLLEPCPTSL